MASEGFDQSDSERSHFNTGFGEWEWGLVAPLEGGKLNGKFDDFTVFISLWQRVRRYAMRESEAAREAQCKALHRT